MHSTLHPPPSARATDMRQRGLQQTAVLEIDFQPWVIELGHDAAAVHRAHELRRDLRSTGSLIVCSRYLSLDTQDPLRSDPESEAAIFHSSMSPQLGDLVVTKHDRDVWTNPDLHAQLQTRGITDIVVMGFLTDYGVDLAARSALRLGYRVSVQAGGCAGSTLDAHVAALDSLADAGIDIV